MSASLYGDEEEGTESRDVSDTDDDDDESDDGLPCILKGQTVNPIAWRTKRTRDPSKRCSASIVSKKDAPWQRMLDMNEKGGNTIEDETSTDGKYF